MIQWSILLRLFPAIQFALFGISGILLLGALAGFLLQGSAFADSVNSVTGPGKKPEKRRQPRHPSDATIEFLDAYFNASSDRADVLNLSKEGACLLTARHMAVGEKFFARLRLTPAVALRVAGQVVWEKPGNRQAFYGVLIKRF